MTSRQEPPLFVVCDFRGVWKVGKLDPRAPFGLPEMFTGSFATEAEALAHAEKCRAAAMPGWMRYAQGDRSA